MLNKLFKLSERNTDVKTEAVAGLTTFLAMAYIIFVNPSILAAAGMDKTALITVTCLATALATLFTGLFANAPIAMAPGMGLNAFFAYSLVLTDKLDWQTALGVVFLSGLFFFLLTAVGIRQKIVEAIPRSLISAVSVGIGFFITFIGLVNLGMIHKNEVTLVSAAPITPMVVTGLAGFLVMILLEMRRIKGSMIAESPSRPSSRFSPARPVAEGARHLPFRPRPGRVPSQCARRAQGKPVRRDLQPDVHASF